MIVKLMELQYESSEINQTKQIIRLWLKTANEMSCTFPVLVLLSEKEKHGFNDLIKHMQLILIYFKVEEVKVLSRAHWRIGRRLSLFLYP